MLGAVAAKIYGEPTKELRLLGVTGTNGKTTTSFLLDAVLRRLGPAALIGTIETRIGDEVVKSVRTTPEATDLQALFAVMREQAVAWCAMEVSSHALAMGRVDGARFAVAGFTNLTQDHLDFHKTFEEYFAAKASLFTPERCDLAVVTIDDEYGRRLAAQTVVPLVTVSTTGDADWTCRPTHQSEHGTTVLDIAGAGGDADRRDRAARRLQRGERAAGGGDAAAARRTGRGDRRRAADSRGAGPDGDLHPRRRPGGDRRLRAHAGRRRARTARRRADGDQGPVVAVVGCGGDRDPGKRPGDGRGRGPGGGRRDRHRRQPAQRGPGGDPGGGASREPGPPCRTWTCARWATAAQAIATAIELAGPGDTVVVLGKGHETGQDVDGVIHPFDDRQTVRELLEADPVIPVSCGQIADAVGGELVGVDPAAVVDGAVVIDSREAGPGGLFVALPGRARRRPRLRRRAASGRRDRLAHHPADRGQPLHRRRRRADGARRAGQPT